MAATQSRVIGDGERVCTFYVDGQFFGVPVQEVQEVIRHQQMTQVPLAPQVIRGLINLRGQIVMAMDLRRRMSFADRKDEQFPLNVVVRNEDGAVSLLVDEIGDVIEMSGEAFELPPETLRGAAREVIRGVYKLDSKLLLILDTAKILQIQNPQRSSHV